MGWGPAATSGAPAPSGSQARPLLLQESSSHGQGGVFSPREKRGESKALWGAEGGGRAPGVQPGVGRMSSPVDERLILAAVVLDLEHPHWVCWPPGTPAHQP